MYYGSKEDQDRHVQTLIKEHRDAAALFPAIRKVCAAFDGKVYNVRFTKALREATGARVFTEAKTETIYIYIYGHAGRWIHLANLSRADMADGKRINAAKLIESARICRESHLKKAYELELAAAKADLVKQQLQDLEQLLQAILKDIPYEIRDTYNINARLTY